MNKLVKQLANCEPQSLVDALIRHGVWSNDKQTYCRVEHRIPPRSLLGPLYSTRRRPRTPAQDCGSNFRPRHDFRPETNCHPRKRQSLSKFDRAGHSWYIVTVHCIHAPFWCFCILNKANVKSCYVLKSRSPALCTFQITALGERIALPRRIWSRHVVRTGIRFQFKPRIQTPDPDDFQNLMGTSLSKDTSVIEFWWRSAQFFFRDVSHVVTECPITQCRVILQKVLDSNAEAEK